MLPQYPARQALGDAELGHDLLDAGAGGVRVSLD
jgi:hypothetical protein